MRRLLQLITHSGILRLHQKQLPFLISFDRTRTPSPFPAAPLPAIFFSFSRPFSKTTESESSWSTNFVRLHKVENKKLHTRETKGKTNSHPLWNDHRALKSMCMCRSTLCGSSALKHPPICPHHIHSVDAICRKLNDLLPFRINFRFYPDFRLSFDGRRLLNVMGPRTGTSSSTQIKSN